MKVFIVLCMFVAAAVAQEIYQPMPYAFNYASPSEDGGSSSHQETGDGAGHVSGSYTLNNLEGHSRVVEYVADEGGFRATVRTNEPGTANINPANVIMESSAEALPMSYSIGLGAAPATGPLVAPPSRYLSPIAPVAPAGQAGMRYMLVPTTDPRARGYY